MANDMRTIKDRGLIPEGAEVTVNPDLCDIIPEANKREIREWLRRHPEFEAAVWTGDRRPGRTLYSAAAGERFGAESWSATELFRQVYLAACPERKHTVDRRSPGFHARNIWTYEGATLKQIAERAAELP
ncbi:MULTISPECIES: hypothetical protein [Kitasatospora]|uniref:Uncharacterized protein n=1 Tax=Kitasatospora setae (strain ATCC 33774 / DSM 43861 / JCM 3304 / KCC A-0304 / NBRC 14216 / KM-6054) TaxID=452652 RepID=E4N6M5_KITSK|nr:MULTISPECIES: hypothetical protein [Kitasatospora]BAJ26856.1 hypothetical protein KSE_10210 [Kitasatospora setae KM-6054]